MMQTLRLPGLSRLLCLLALCAPLAARADEHIHFDTGSPPTMYRGADGRASGIYPALVAAAFRRAQIPIQAEATPFRRMIAVLQQPPGGAGAVIRTAERERLADFSAPYFLERVMVYARRPLPDAGLDQLRGLRVGVIRGWSYGDPFDQARQLREFQVEEVERDVQNFEKLRLGRVDAVLATEPAGELLLRLPRFRGLQAMPRPLWVFGIHLAFARSPSRRELLQAFDREIAAMQESGEWAQLVQRESEAARGEL
jgi:polar amino acid transport system substrate-binding protein